MLTVLRGQRSSTSRLLLWQHLHSQQRNPDAAENESGGDQENRAASSDGRRGSKATASPIVRYVQQSVFDLCVAAPTLLGKYAWRFPGFSATVTASAPADDHSARGTAGAASDAFLWNLLGSRLSSAAVGAGPVKPTVRPVQWKTKKPSGSSAPSPLAVGTPLPPPTDRECQRQAQANYCTLLQGVISVVSQRKQLRLEHEQVNHQQGGQTQLPDNEKDTITSFIRVVDKIASARLLSDLFISQVATAADRGGNGGSGDEGRWPPAAAAPKLNELQELLVRWPVAATSTAPPSDREGGGSGDTAHKVKTDDDGGETSGVARNKPRRYHEEDSLIDGLRRTLKILLSLSESVSQPASATFSSKAD